MSEYIDTARKLRQIIEQAAQSFDDKTASEAPTLFRRLKADGGLITAGTRINWRGAIKRVTVNLWDTKENSPDNAPTLWADITYREGVRIIPATIVAEEAFAEGEQGWWGDVLYISLLEGNIHTPEQYAQGWTAAT